MPSVVGVVEVVGVIKPVVPAKVIGLVEVIGVVKPVLPAKVIGLVEVVSTIAPVPAVENFVDASFDRGIVLSPYLEPTGSPRRDDSAETRRRLRLRRTVAAETRGHIADPPESLGYRPIRRASYIYEVD